MKPIRGPDVFWLCAHGVAWGSLLLALVVAVPRVEAIFVDFGVPLSFHSRVVITISHLACRLPLVMPLGLGSLLAGDWFVLAAFRGRGEARASRAWSLFVLITPLVMFGAAALSLLAVALNVDQHLSG